MGVEIPLAHHFVDRLLGFDRPFAQSRLQITPVEWGIWSFLALRALDALDGGAGNEPDRAGIPGLLGPGDLTLDRVGPDAFNPNDLGSIVTIRWLVHVGSMSGAVRLWVPESVVQLWLASAGDHIRRAATDGTDAGPAEQAGATHPTVPRGELTGTWWRPGGRGVDAPGAAAAAGRGCAAALGDAADRLTAEPDRPG